MNNPEIKTEDNITFKKYHMSYSYLISGMNGISDIKDLGFIYATDEDEAKEEIMDRVYWDIKDEDSRDLIKGCLIAKDTGEVSVRKNNEVKDEYIVTAISAQAGIPEIRARRIVDNLRSEGIRFILEDK